MANIKRAVTSGLTKSGTAIPDVPDAPTIGTVSVTNATTVSVPFTAAATGGAPTSYTVAATPTVGDISTNAGTTSPRTATGTFAEGIAYTFTIRGVNSTATGPVSSSSNSVTPVLAQASYMAGGSSGSGGYTAAIEKVTFASETASVLSPTLRASMDNLGGYANSGTAGYVGGGSNPESTDVDKLVFSTESKSTLGTGLSQARYGLAGFANSGTAGYFAGGVNDSSTTVANIVDKHSFSDDSRSTLGTGLSYRPFSCSAFANSGTAGYVGGGYNYAPGADPIFPAFFDKFSFSNDARTTLADRIVHAGTSRTYMAGFANSGTAGYLASSVANNKDLTKFVFSNETSSTLSNKLSVNTYRAVASAKVGSFGYVTQGEGTTIQKFVFSTDTASSITATLTYWHTAGAGFANSGTI